MRHATLNQPLKHTLNLYSTRHTLFQSTTQTPPIPSRFCSQSVSIDRSVGISVVKLHPGFNKTDMTKKYAHIWEIEGAVDPEIGAKSKPN